MGEWSIGNVVMTVMNDWDKERKRLRIIQICAAVVVILVLVAIIWSILRYGL